ncbi:Iron-sulfur cluster-binding domain-containing protein [Selenomonas ruminantium]|uniref:Iron-sulfur cluster-binding domain-containing protein n=1 Tax=Selenomonas ruminantium TaxID=971 RepID=A0A1M6W2R6_SELRU|nr:radical SAM/SPASM domain-containing protein [Selenomonas ruminantium]SHK87969.1 Iron-sulfur cluster-binding domain-containing protein [Selenomonas ruminantium]
MRICERALNFIQIINAEGIVRNCSWQYDGGVIGKLSEASMEEIYNSEEANLIRKKHFDKDYSNCNPNACPYVANNNVDKHSLNVDEVPKFPQELHLAYENVCNYHCVTCTIPSCMEYNRSRQEILEQQYNHIDNELKKVLPYVKHLTANGLGEFFVSKHIMRLMQNWEPNYPAKECRAGIETNGSLFNEKNWKKVENLSRFNLEVAITVMSFEEEAYQYLSGTKLPVSNIIDNLRFVKELRERGIINHLELATVYQEGNFRTLPEFSRRCIEEFGADYVRLRPYEPWVDPGLDDWMKDVRNADNPYHGEFLQVMKHEIFKHPKVHDWGGGKESGLGKAIYPKSMSQFRLMDKILCIDDFSDRVKNVLDSETVMIYAMTTAGRFLTKILSKDMIVPYLMDRGQSGNVYQNIPIMGVSNFDHLDKDLPVIIALTTKSAIMVKEMLKRAGYKRKIVTIDELMVLIA